MTRQPGLRGLSLPMPTESEPLTLRLPDGRGQLTCLEAVREVRGKRCVYRCRWHDTDVYAKVFIGRLHARRRWQREKRGIEALAAHGLATPPLLYAGLLAEPRAYALITEALSPVETLAEAWQRPGVCANHSSLLERMGETLAAQHEAGVLQRDPHLGNFLLSCGRLYSIDASKLLVYGHPIPMRKALANLALLLAQLEPRHDIDAQNALRAYVRARGWARGEGDLPRLLTLIDHARVWRKRAFLRKVFRECTAYACSRTRAQRLVYDKHYVTAGFMRLYEDPECAFVVEGARFLKRGNTATVVVRRIDKVDVVIKRYNVKGLWHSMRHMFKRTRASISWGNAHLLRFYGISTPQPIAFVERRVGLLRRTSYYMSEYVEGIDGREFFGSDDIPNSAKEAMAERVVAALVTLARYRVRHGDLKATNIIIRDVTPYWVDLDAMREYKTTLLFRPALERDIVRLLRNWEDRPDIRQLFQQAFQRVRTDRDTPPGHQSFIRFE